MSPNRSVFRDAAPRAIHYPGVYNPLATFAALRDGNVLGKHAYLHVTGRRAEIGWAPIEHLRLLAGQPCLDWRAQLGSFARVAEQCGSKAFGYVGFDAVDDKVGTLPDRSQSGRPLVEFIIPGEILEFAEDHVVHRSSTGIPLDPYLANTTLRPLSLAGAEHALVPIAETSEASFSSAVRAATAAIAEGAAQKLVLSRYQVYEAEFDPVALFAAASRSFSDAFLIQFDDLMMIVFSPELVLAGDSRQISSNPLAGTRPRGRTPEQDELFRRELIGNHKEIVEHVISVKAMLAELEAICDPSSLSVTRFMDIAVQPNVQHFSSWIKGGLRSDRQILDALWALFPAVTVTGLPKQPALNIIRNLEQHPRYLYAGVLGWVRGESDCRFSLAIRGIFRCGTRSFLHSGAGIMAESLPEAEWSETSHKLALMRNALCTATALRGNTGMSAPLVRGRATA